MGTFNNGSLAVYVYNNNLILIHIKDISTSTDLLKVASLRNTFADRETAKQIGNLATTILSLS